MLEPEFQHHFTRCSTFPFKKLKLHRRSVSRHRLALAAFHQVSRQRMIRFTQERIQTWNEALYQEVLRSRSQP
jgi:hypothetical protein